MAAIMLLAQGIGEKVLSKLPKICPLLDICTCRILFRKCTIGKLPNKYSYCRNFWVPNS